MFTTEAVHHIKDGEVDYVCVDVRDDNCGFMEDMELYWPKVRITAGHDFLYANEAPNQDYSLCMNYKWNAPSGSSRRFRGDLNRV